MKIDFDFHYHPAGQGLFYSGHFFYKDRQVFKFIYDCGSYKPTISHLENYIEHHFLRDIVPDGHIDLLIISHFDYDHISGLNKLLNHIKRIDKIVLPYIGPIERLALATGLMDKAGAGNQDENELTNSFPINGTRSLWARRFLGNPYQLLGSDEKVGKLIIMGRSGGERKNDTENQAPREPGGRNGLDFDNLPDDEDTRLQLINHESLSPDAQTKCSVKQSGTTALLGLWEFNFWFHSPSKNLLSQFEKELATNDLKPQNAAELARILNSKEKLQKLKDLFKTAGGSMNNTSLLLFHGPIQDKRIQHWSWPGRPQDFYRNYFNRHWAYYHYKRSFYHHIWTRNNAHLLTGDINLAENYTEIKSYFNSSLKRVNYALVPHHGAEKYWDDRIISDMIVARSTLFWYVSAGMSRPYKRKGSSTNGHPHDEVVNSLMKYGQILFWCNEYNHLVITGELLID